VLVTRTFATGAIFSAVLGLSVCLLGQSQPEQKPLAFDVASVKPNTSGDNNVAMIPSPNGITISNATLQMMVRLAYRVQDFQILDAPNWFASARFDVAAKADRSVPQQDLPVMLRALLGERFKLAAHNETRELPVYALVRAHSDGTFGPQLRTPSACVRPAPNQPAASQAAPVTSALPPCGNKVLPGNMSSRGVTMLTLTVNLSVFLGRTVTDRTGFAEMFDYDLTWTPDVGSQLRNASPATDATGPSLFTALQEQLGLKLESTKAPVDVLVIDHVERPTPD
jgi:uncharacterized protein (TIGR03435 family)